MNQLVEQEIDGYPLFQRKSELNRGDNCILRMNWADAQRSIELMITQIVMRVQIKQQAGKENVLPGICYRPAN